MEYPGPGHHGPDHPKESKGADYTFSECINEGTKCTKKMGEDAPFGLAWSTCGSIGTACAKIQPEVRDEVLNIFPWRNQEFMMKGKVFLVESGRVEALVRSNQSLEAKEEGSGWDATKWDGINSILTRSCITTRLKARRSFLTKPGAELVWIQLERSFCPSTVHPGALFIRAHCSLGQKCGRGVAGAFQEHDKVAEVGPLHQETAKVRGTAQMRQEHSMDRWTIKVVPDAK